jgi:hypothetical protein
MESPDRCRTLLRWGTACLLLLATPETPGAGPCWSANATFQLRELERQEMILLKPGVTIEGLCDETASALWTISSVYMDETGGPPTITSALDGDHAHNSKHYEGLALDLRVKGLQGWQCRQLESTLNQRLGVGWRILYGDAGHLDHIHVEFTDKRVNEWPVDGTVASWGHGKSARGTSLRSKRAAAPVPVVAFSPDEAGVQWPGLLQRNGKLLADGQAMERLLHPKLGEALSALCLQVIQSTGTPPRLLPSTDSQGQDSTTWRTAQLAVELPDAGSLPRLAKLVESRMGAGFQVAPLGGVVGSGYGRLMVQYLGP